MGRGVKVHNGDRALWRRPHVDDFAAVAQGLLLGDVQMSTQMKPRRDRLLGFEKTALASVPARGGQIGQANGTSVGQQDVHGTLPDDPLGP